VLNEINVITANLRLHKAKKVYNSAKRHFDNADYGAANDRAFFCMYHAANAVCALDERKIGGDCSVMYAFHQIYVDDCYFDESYLAMMEAAHKSRYDSNYSDYHIESKEEALRNVENAGRFFEAMEDFIARRVRYQYNPQTAFDPDDDDELEL
jgi:uncharacterized protein (UPF0332 family)